MTVENPLAAHLISQIEQNVQLLTSQNYLSQADSNEILARLPTHDGSMEKGSSPMSQLSSKFSKLVSPSSNQRVVPPPPPPPAVHAPAVVHAKALWGYNEAGEDPKDLTFAAGDIIEIIDETNADWWTGRFNGKQGLVPANYVTKIAPPANPAFVAMPEPGPRPYKPFGAVYHGVNSPPPAGEGVNASGLQQSPETEQKKDKLGKLGNTMAHSAAGGVGFGAGAAIGGGLIRAIF